MFRLDYQVQHLPVLLNGNFVERLVGASLCNFPRTLLLLSFGHQMMSFTIGVSKICLFV